MQAEPVDALVIGSINLDYRFKVSELPVAGVTTRAETDRIEVGGKGVNQARALKRFGVDARLVAAVGKDAEGDQAAQALVGEGIRHHLFRAVGRTGRVIITIDPRGQNLLIIDPGANQWLPAEAVLEIVAEFSGPILLQMEMEKDLLERLLTQVDPARQRVFLDGGPILLANFHLFRKTFVFSPNLGELSILFGQQILDSEDLLRAIAMLQNLGVRRTVVKLGELGAAYCVDADAVWMVPAYTVPAVDTTGAGDCFMGVLAYGIERGQDWLTAVQLANAAAALSTTKLGVSASFPGLEETLAFQRSTPAPAPIRVLPGLHLSIKGAV